MKKLRILVDQDGVLADYETSVLDIFHHRHPEIARVPADELVLFETENNYPEIYRPEIDAIALETGFYANLPPLPGALEALRELLAEGHDVRICTAPKRQAVPCVSEKYDWVKRHLGQAWQERTISTRDKTLVRGDYLIDDKPEVKGVMAPEWEHIIFDRLYNRHVTGKRRLDWQNYRKVLDI
jgi:5'-nucleotidase